MQDTGRSPLHFYYWMTGHPETERVDPIAGDVRAVRRDSRERHGARKIKAALERRGVTTSGRHIGGIMHEQGMTSAYTRRRSEPHGTRVNEAKREPVGPAGPTATPPHTRPAGDLTSCLWSNKRVRRRRRLGVRVPAGRPGGQGHRRPFRRAGPGRGPGAGRIRHPRLPADGRPGVPHRPGFDDARIDEPFDVFNIKRSLPRKGNPYDNAVAESTNRLLKKELVYRNHYTTIEQLRHDLNDYVWWSDDQRLHSTLGYRSPKEFTEQGLVLKELSNTPLPIHRSFPTIRWRTGKRRRPNRKATSRPHTGPASTGTNSTPARDIPTGQTDVENQT